MATHLMRDLLDTLTASGELVQVARAHLEEQPWIHGRSEDATESLFKYLSPSEDELARANRPAVIGDGEVRLTPGKRSPTAGQRCRDPIHREDGGPRREPSRVLRVVRERLLTRFPGPVRRGAFTSPGATHDPRL